MQDQWDILCSQARYFTYSKFLEMKSGPKLRLLWLVDKLAALQARGAENLFIGLLRQIRGGDYSSENVLLIQKLYQIFFDHKNWFYQQTQLIPFTIFSFLRIIAGNGIDLELRKMMATFSAALLLEKFKECSVIGRDLIRILQDVSKLPEFIPVWSLLYKTSSSSSSSSTSSFINSTEYKNNNNNNNIIESTQIFKILHIPSPKKFLASRLTPDMEINLLFILDHVKYGGNHRRYYEWFSAEYLKVNDPDSLIIDIVRYLIVAYHPPNAILASSSVQRWQIISWFLRQMKTNYSTTNAKLALFFDWLFYDPSIDNIMNIEPAILIITKSVPVNPKITCTMLEFLHLLRKDYLPALSARIESNIDKSMFDILTKRVISNLESILLSDQVSEDIKRQTKELFPCYLSLNSFKHPESPKLSAIAIKESDSMAVLRKCVSDISKYHGDSSISFSDINVNELMSKFIESLGSITDHELEEIELSLTSVIRNFNDDVYDIWSEALLNALTGPKSSDKDIIDRAIERISLLPQNSFNIESFVLTSMSPMSISKSSSGGISVDNNSIPDDQNQNQDKDDQVMISNSIEDQIRQMKFNDPDSFYNNCFTRFNLELCESPNFIELLEAILEETDPLQLFKLKKQLLSISNSINPFIINWNNFLNELPSTREWDGYCQIFLWDLLLISFKRFSDVYRTQNCFKEILIKLKFTISNPERNSEICNGIVNLALSLYPNSSGKSFNLNLNNEYFSWLLILLEEGSESISGILPILTFYWRSNSRLFLQSLVRLDEEEAIEGLNSNKLSNDSFNNRKKINKTNVKNSLTIFRQIISELDENSPTKSSLLSCLDTTLALLK